MSELTSEKGADHLCVCVCSGKNTAMECRCFSSTGEQSDPKGDKEPSCVSMRSDRSIMHPPQFSSGKGEPSCVSMRSDRSIMHPPQFSSGKGEPSCVSMKSDRSIMHPPQFSSGGGEPCCVSMKSDRSIMHPPQFSSGKGEPSCVSMKSDRSIMHPPQFSSGKGEPCCVSMKSDRSITHPPQFSTGRGEPCCVSMKRDRSIGNPPAFRSGPEPSYLEQHPKEAVLERHRVSMKKKYESLFEGIKTEENKTLLNRIYTQLYIIEGESEGVNEEHEVLQMEETTRKRLQDTPITCIDIFKPDQGKQGQKRKRKEGIKENKGSKVPELRAVLTKGIAGIGKTVSVQKFILDWAEGKANQDVELMLVLPFRELNLIKDDQYSLHGLLCDFHPELKDLDPKIYDQLKAVFIFDGLDESRIPLNFKRCEIVSDITTTTSVGVLMTNLIKGELLPSALIWITSRPAAANQIPPQYINCVTEIQGFSDPQKEEYFKKRISDEDQAKKIMLHIKTARSLYIMCHIPVFCWISATVLQQIMKQSNTEIPTTLTEMYTHFLITQINMKNEKFEGDKKEESKTDTKNLLESNRVMLLKLAELAFKQLMKGNVIFYEEDLRKSGIDVKETSVYSGIFTEIFREESVIYQKKVYCFVHLSFQEFLAAVYVFHCYESNNKKTLDYFRPQHENWSKNVPLDCVLQGAVDKAVESQNGHLDLFLRFLLGISVKSNQRLLQGLLTQAQNHSEETIQYIKRLIKEDDAKPHHISTDESINLLLCLSEMKDQSLAEVLQKYLTSEKSSEKQLTPGQCTALTYMRVNSGVEVDDGSVNQHVCICTKALLAGCDLTKDSCEALCSPTGPAPAEELFLQNPLGDHLTGSPRSSEESPRAPWETT
ncbi:NLR family CARD domain-containing protein 3-like isoform X2 [Pygocentrus nattereri]|uniref:NACHT domain-containing protein n=1 Tax=Pygocentrus nattereri TaxID=42514 RepID=A0A3B4D6Q6_PYGNA|nr:NLR family CARD domain-containing protein 3-like isoform X2 [Pygocentrus nattereri]